MEHERGYGSFQSTPQSTPGMQHSGEGSLAPKLLDFTYTPIFKKGQKCSYSSDPKHTRYISKHIRCRVAVINRDYTRNVKIKSWKRKGEA